MLKFQTLKSLSYFANVGSIKEEKFRTKRSMFFELYDKLGSIKNCDSA